MEAYFSWMVAVSCIVGIAWAQGGPDDFYIMIDRVEVHKCAGQPNSVQIRKEDIEIVDEDGDKINYIKAPGKIQIRFNRVSLDQPLPYISGEMSALLDIPVINVGSFINFNIPYSVIPEKRLTADVCDRESGVVTKQENGRQNNYCRYCDLCATSARTEQSLSRNNYLPEVEKSRKELSFRRICNRLDAKTYSIMRTVQLPGKRELERQANQQFQGVGADIKRRFNVGKGRFLVRLHLLTSNSPAKDYATTQKERCSGGQGGLLSGLINGFTCNARCNVPFLGEDCRAYYAQNCISGERMAACYTTEFFYTATDKYSEVQQFLAQKGLTDNYLQSNSGRSKPEQSPQTNTVVQGANQGLVPTAGAARTGGQGNWRRDCVNFIPEWNKRIKSICNRYLQQRRWNPRCCDYCQGFCPANKQQNL